MSGNEQTFSARKQRELDTALRRIAQLEKEVDDVRRDEWRVLAATDPRQSRDRHAQDFAALTRRASEAQQDVSRLSASLEAMRAQQVRERKYQSNVLRAAHNALDLYRKEKEVVLARNRALEAVMADALDTAEMWRATWLTASLSTHIRVWAQSTWRRLKWTR